MNAISTITILSKGGNMMSQPDKKKVEVEEIRVFLNLDKSKVLGNPYRFITHPAPIDEAKSEYALCFAGATQSMAGAHKIDAPEKIRDTKAGVIVTSQDITSKLEDIDRKTFILVDNPRLSYIRILREFFEEKLEWGIHPTAIIHPGATIDLDVYIGPYTVVGKSVIGKGSIIHGHVCIYDNVVIGKNVEILGGCIIGGKGFGFERDENGKLEKFPQLGRLIIGDDVEIQGLCNIEIGSLADTVIGHGTKIDSCCHIAHNCKIGNHCVITADAMFAAGVELSDYVWLSPSSVLRNRIKIGKKAQVGIGAVVVKDVHPGELVMGIPARPEKEFKKYLKKMKE